MHKLHNHRFKHTKISKILMDMHLLMLHDTVQPYDTTQVRSDLDFGV